MLRDPEVEHFFTRLIQRVAPKSYVQGKPPLLPPWRGGDGGCLVDVMAGSVWGLTCGWCMSCAVQPRGR
jgi:hypothetical protein